MTAGKRAWCSALGLALVAGALGIRVSAQESKNDVFWEVRQRQQIGAAAQMVLAGNPLVTLVLRAEGLRWKVWWKPEYISDAAPALNPDWLDLVRDGTPMPNFRG